MTKPIPFSVNRNDARTLGRQVTDGLRRAIVEGYYAPGDLLPSSYSLVEELGVSRIVTRAALRQLAEEGLAVARPRVGTVVRDRAEKRWLGHVAFICPDREVGYFQTIFADELRNRLNEAGYLFTRAGVRMRTDQSCDLSLLDAALTHAVALAVVLYDRPQIAQYLSRRKIPFAVAGERLRKTDAPTGITRLDFGLALPDFVGACTAAGVRQVVQVGWMPQDACDARPALKAAGIAVRRLVAKPDLAAPLIESVERAGYDLFSGLCRRRALSRDALYFITDDYLARGAVTALLQAGMRIPEDIHVVLWANSGLVPVYSRPFSRMEMNPAVSGRVVADAVLQYLRTGTYPPDTVIGPAWVPGETM